MRGYDTKIKHAMKKFNYLEIISRLNDKGCNKNSFY